MPIKSKIGNIENKTETRDISRKEDREKEGGRSLKRRSKNIVKEQVIRSSQENQIKKKTIESLLPTKV